MQLDNIEGYIITKALHFKDDKRQKFRYVVQIKDLPKDHILYDEILKTYDELYEKFHSIKNIEIVNVIEEIGQTYQKIKHKYILLDFKKSTSVGHYIEVNATLSRSGHIMDLLVGESEVVEYLEWGIHKLNIIWVD